MGYHDHGCGTKADQIEVIVPARGEIAQGPKRNMVIRHKYEMDKTPGAILPPAQLPRAPPENHGMGEIDCRSFQALLEQKFIRTQGWSQRSR